MLAVTLAQLACFYVRYYTPLLPPVSVPIYPFTLLLGLTLLVTGLMFGAVGAYRLPRRFRLYTVSATLLRTMAGHIAIITLAVFLLRLGTQHSRRPFLYSRPVVVAGWLLMFALLLAWRLAFGRLQRALFARGRGARRMVVIGTGPRARQVAAALQEQRWLGYEILGLIGPPIGEQSAFPVLGEVASLPDVAARLGADVAWLASPAERFVETLDLIFTDPALPVRWATARGDFERLLQTGVGEQTPPNLSSWSKDDLRVELAKRVKCEPDPLAGPHVALVGSRGIPATYGGVERYVEELGARLAERGYRVSAYCRPHYTSRRGSYRGVELRHLPCVRTKHLEAISHTLLATLHLLFREDEIVHYQALGPSLLAWLPRLFGRKTVVTVQGLDWQRTKWGPLARTVLRIGEWASAHLPHRTIVVSHALESYYQDRHGKAVTYIPNGVNGAQHRPACEIRELGLQEGSYVLAVGRLVPEKGVHTLIRAFRLLETDKQLVIVGGSSHTERYVASLHRVAEDIPVVFTGYVYGRVLEELYSNAYLFVSASEIEGLPIALLEAMSFGTCVLASDIPPHLEVLSGLGYTFRVGNGRDLAAQLQALLDQPQAVARTGETLRRWVVSTYSWHLVADATDKVYRELLGKRAGRAA